MESCLLYGGGMDNEYHEPTLKTLIYVVEDADVPQFFFVCFNMFLIKILVGFGILLVYVFLMFLCF